MEVYFTKRDIENLFFASQLIIGFYSQNNVKSDHINNIISIAKEILNLLDNDSLVLSQEDLQKIHKLLSEAIDIQKNDLQNCKIQSQYIMTQNSIVSLQKLYNIVQEYFL